MDKMNRREFLQRSGSAALGLGAAGLLLDSCKGKGNVASAAPERERGMEYRINPANGDKVSLLGYGCMRWPMIKDASGNEVIDQETVNALVDAAMAAGINYYDTSPRYLQGQSEKAAGIALSRYPRDSYYIATKLSNFGDNSAEASMAMYRESFKQLRTEYFDYYLLHSIGGGGLEQYRKRYVENGMTEFLLKEKEAGRIRNFCFSFHGNRQAFDDFMALHDSGEMHWDFCQIEMNYVDWTHADGIWNVNADYLYAELDKREIPIMVMEPLLGGRLADVPRNVAEQLKTREPDKSVASWAFRFVGSYPWILCILSGMTSMEPLQDNIGTFSAFKPLDDEELAFMEEMARLIKEYPMVNCTNCKYCMPCPFGIDIPGIFQAYNKAVTDGTYKKAKQFLKGYNAAVPALRQADHCIGCGQCKVHCPQSIHIPEELHRIDEMTEKLKRESYV